MNEYTKKQKADYDKKSKEVGEFVEKMIAKKDFEISHNSYNRKIKAGEDISDVPTLYHQNLKTEKVI